MAIDLEAAKKLAVAYTAAWNSGSSEAVAAFYAQNGQIAINRGNPRFAKVCANHRKHQGADRERSANRRTP